MRKFFHFLVFLFLCFLFGECFVVFLSKGNYIQYQTACGNQTCLIEETYQNDSGQDRYHFVINDQFTFDIFVPLYKTSKLIQDIFYYHDNTYMCIYPVFRTKKIKMDILCKKNHLFYYHTIQGKNKKLDAFASSLPSYDASLFEESDSEKTVDLVTLYPENIMKNHFIALQNYKGIYHISQKNLAVSDEYYSQDVYEPTLAAASGKYFVSALYDGEDSFDKLVVIRLDKNKQGKMNIPTSSLSSTFHVVENKIYLQDSLHDRIYLISPSKKTYKRVESIPIQKSSYQNKNYDKIEETLYYYYLYKQENGKIRVSRVSKENPSLITYLFTVDMITKVQYYDDFIYFISDDSLYSYSDGTGLRKVLLYEELHFNKALSYFVYKKH